MAARVELREISNEEGNRLLRIVRPKLRHLTQRELARKATAHTNTANVA